MPHKRFEGHSGQELRNQTVSKLNQRIIRIQLHWQTKAIISMRNHLHHHAPSCLPLMTCPKNGKLDVLLIFSFGRHGHIATHYELCKRHNKWRLCPTPSPTVNTVNSPQIHTGFSLAQTLIFKHSMQCLLHILLSLVSPSVSLPSKLFVLALSCSYLAR